jgi:putative FmdB family regulatory protein
MALYTYRCPKCDHRVEVSQRIKEYCETPRVPGCGLGHDTVKMERYLTAPLISFDTSPWGAYRSPIDGSVIDSRAKRNEHMAVHGVVPYDEIAPDFERSRKRIQSEFHADVKKELIEATHRCEAGYKPVVETIDNIIPENA